LGARERAEAVGARLVIDSAPGKGTKIAVVQDEATNPGGIMRFDE
jgi:hypothetical protein